ncbi:MAG TPA: hypothetical protein PLU50_00155 [Pseudobdellovibrionaceae bacterium]|nr:hypothetical protein [Pseudobdellovibrionaceae bacterium]
MRHTDDSQKNAFIKSSTLRSLAFLAGAFLFSTTALTFEQLERPETSIREMSVRFKFHERSLSPGESMMIEIPGPLKNRDLESIDVIHKQDPHRQTSNCQNGEQELHDDPEWDCTPAYLAVEVEDLKSPLEDNWRYWAGPGSGPRNSKFSEVRNGYGEVDRLYEWMNIGHRGVRSHRLAKSPVHGDRLRLSNLGRDRLTVSEITYSVSPKPVTSVDFKIFMTGFKFGDWRTSAGRTYAYEPLRGNYGDSLSIHPGVAPNDHRIPQQWEIRPGRLKIPTRNLGNLQFIDVAIGDLNPVPPGENDKRYRGGAVVDIFISNEGQREYWSRGENVGSSGVIRARPPSQQQAMMRDGDYINIEIRNSKAWIMGIQFGSN